MKVSVNFRDGNRITWYSDSNDYPDEDWFNEMKLWSKAVVEGSCAWVSAALHGRRYWSYGKLTLPYHPMGVYPDLNCEITSLDVDAVYVADDNDILIYYINPTAQPESILPKHYHNRGRVVDLRCPLVDILEKYQYEQTLQSQQCQI